MAYIDESIRSASGLYVFGAVCIETFREDPIRQALTSALPRGRRRFHWRLDSRDQRLLTLRLTVALPTTLVVIYQGGIDPKRAERHRQHLLWNLVADLDRAFGVHDLVFESREASQNAKDAKTLQNISRAGLGGPHFRHSFARPLDEPLLWLADTGAGACGFAIANQGVELSGLCDRYSIAVIEVPPLP